RASSLSPGDQSSELKARFLVNGSHLRAIVGRFDLMLGKKDPERIHLAEQAAGKLPLAMTMPAVPSCVPVSAPQQASACARALSTVTSCQPHGNSSQPCAPVFAAAGLSLLPAWCAARLAGGQPGGLPSSQHCHAGGVCESTH